MHKSDNVVFSGKSFGISNEMRVAPVVLRQVLSRHRRYRGDDKAKIAIAFPVGRPIDQVDTDEMKTDSIKLCTPQDVDVD